MRLPNVLRIRAWCWPGVEPRRQASPNVIGAALGAAFWAIRCVVRAAGGSHGLGDVKMLP
jgi:hypothetical protein